MIYRCDLTKQYEQYAEEINRAILGVLGTGRYVLAAQVEEFEKEFARYCATKYCVSVANGTDALQLALRAYDIGPGDEVVTTPFTAIPTISAIIWTGAIPRFADIDYNTFCVDPSKIEAAVTPRTKAIMPVHLFGQSVEMGPLLEIARTHKIPVIEDACQAHGTLYRGSKAGSIGNIGCFSFYPTKNLGAYGDGGALVTNDEALAKKLALIRNYGQTSPYVIGANGTNSRLDEIQAAILRVKLKHLDGMNARRQLVADEYEKNLRGLDLKFPHRLPHTYHNHHVYVVRARKRDELQQYLEKNKIQSNVYYPLAHHLQEPYKFLGYRKGDFPVAEAACGEVLAFPFYPEISLETVHLVCAKIQEFYSTH